LLRYQAFELGVLGLEQLQALEFGDAQPLVLAAPVVEGLLRDAVLATDIELVPLRLSLAQDPNDLLLAEPF
jgi:hypothetical protein